jgi:hypothetical protein
VGRRGSRLEGICKLKEFSDLIGDLPACSIASQPLCYRVTLLFFWKPKYSPGYKIPVYAACIKKVCGYVWNLSCSCSSCSSLISCTRNCNCPNQDIRYVLMTLMCWYPVGGMKRKVVQNTGSARDSSERIGHSLNGRYSCLNVICVWDHGFYFTHVSVWYAPEVSDSPRLLSQEVFRMNQTRNTASGSHVRLEYLLSSWNLIK